MLRRRIQNADRYVLEKANQIAIQKEILEKRKITEEIIIVSLPRRLDGKRCYLRMQREIPHKIIIAFGFRKISDFHFPLCTSSETPTPEPSIFDQATPNEAGVCSMDIDYDEEGLSRGLCLALDS